MLLYFGRQLAIICKGVFNIIMKYIIEITNTRLPRIQIRKGSPNYSLSFDQYVYSQSILHLNEVCLSRSKQYKIKVIAQDYYIFPNVIRICLHF